MKLLLILLAKLWNHVVTAIYHILLFSDLAHFMIQQGCDLECRSQAENPVQLSVQHTPEEFHMEPLAMIALPASLVCAIHETRLALHLPNCIQGTGLGSGYGS